MQVNYHADVRHKVKAKYESSQGDVLLQKLANASFTEIDNWVDANVTTVAQVRTLCKKMLMVVSYLLNKG